MRKKGENEEKKINEREGGTVDGEEDGGEKENEKRYMEKHEK
jgi:hypothetical protein